MDDTKSISQLYQTSPQNVTLHIKNIYADGELYEEATCKDYLQVQSEGSRTVQRKVKIYNLDMILAIGYRVRNNIGIHFRNWSSSVLSEYMKKGFVLNDERLKNPKNLVPTTSMNFLNVSEIFVLLKNVFI